MDFIALPVSKGDSFLIKSEKNILIDTGNNSLQCREILREWGIDHLNLIIITHYDCDHVNGLLELLKSEIRINEIWLPDNFGRINKTMIEQRDSILNKLAEQYLENEDEREYENEFYLHITNEEINLEPDKSIQIICRVKQILLDNSERTFYKILTPIDGHTVEIVVLNAHHLNIINDIITECNRRHLVPLWLKYTNHYQPTLITNRQSIRALNCIENRNIRAYKDDMDAIINLTKINAESLVFQFWNETLPNILFSADSGFEFLKEGEKIELKSKSIVTASHHGSCDEENVRTYDLVEGDNLIYVRSDCKTSSRPCNKYRNLDRKYCTVCNNPQDVHSPVRLIYDNNDWQTENQVCSCHQVQ